MKESRQIKTRRRLPASGGGRIEGLVFWGGVLAVTGFIAAFTFRKRRKVDQETIQLLNEFGMKETEDVRSKELQSSVPIQTLNENTSVIDVNGEIKNCEDSRQETLYSDTEQESIAISEDYCVAEESPELLPVPDSASESMNQNEDESSMESSFSSSTDDEEEEDSSLQSSTSSSTEEEDENPPIQSTKEINNNYDVEKSEESSQSPCVEEELLSGSTETDLCPQVSGGEDCRSVENNGSGKNTRMMRKNKIGNEVVCHKRILRIMTRKFLVCSVLVLMVLCLLTNLILSFYLPQL